MITKIRYASKTSTYRGISTEEFMSELCSGETKYVVENYRKDYIVDRARGIAKQELWAFTGRSIPKFCFAAEWKKQQQMTVMKTFNGMVLLEVNNLRSAEDAETLRSEVARIPYTYIAFVGLSGFSVKFVCRIACEGGFDGLSTEMLERYQLNAYKRLHYIYSSQLGLSVDNIAPTLQSECMLSYDANAYCNEESEILFVKQTEVDVPQYKGEARHTDDPVVFGDKDISALDIIYEWCLRDAVEKARIKGYSDEDLDGAVLSLLADYCCDSNLPIDFAVMRTTWKSRFERFDVNYIRIVFDNAYEGKELHGIRYTHVDKQALMVYKAEAFLRMHYELRRNIITGVVQYRKKNGFDFDFHDLTEPVMNSMTNEAIKRGIGSWDKDMRRITNSNDIPLYDPISSYLFSLPEWDGKDRVKEFISRIPTSCPNVELYMHTWLLSMVAHWLGRDMLHGNALVPVLIGGQGCGKTTFCSIILPPQLRDYYNDKVEFKNETSLALGLSSFALINIDEFDALKKSQQPTLKYIVSKSDVKLRLPYGKSFEQRRRYASFIATTNNRQPLVDHTGSRRFACIEVLPSKRIDYLTPINYAQLYAQLVCEVSHGMKYWLDEDETTELMKHNGQYLRQITLQQKLSFIFSLPSDDDEAKNITPDDVIALVLERYPDTPKSHLNKRDIGAYFRGHEFVSKHTNKGAAYKVKIN